MGSRQGVADVDFDIQQLLAVYLNDLGDQVPANLYNMVMMGTEAALIEIVMKKMKGNQTKVAEFLGISRNTLRKKILAYQLKC
jgi:Fis family transcriptional regulator, factor for inversion stimulation protein